MIRRTMVSVWLMTGVTSSKEPIVLSSRTFASACESAAGVFNCASFGSSYLLFPIMSAYFMSGYFFYNRLTRAPRTYHLQTNKTNIYYDECMRIVNYEFPAFRFKFL